MTITIHRIKISSLDHSKFAKPYWEFNNSYHDESWVFALVYGRYTYLYDNLSDIIPVEFDNNEKGFTLVFIRDWTIIRDDYRSKPQNVENIAELRMAIEMVLR